MAACETLADAYAAASEAYHARTGANSAAWNAFLSAHNAGRADRSNVARLKANYDRSSADLDSHLAVMAASEQSAREFATARWGVCALEKAAGSRYRSLPQPAG